MKKTFSLFTLAALFLCGAEIYAQNETGVRPVDSAFWKSRNNWYDASTAMFQTQFPIITSIPPLSTGMPYDILLSYIYTDSLMRFSSGGQTNAKLKSWTTPNDTVNGLIRYLYRMVDYNPVIFNQYSDEVTHFKRRSNGLRLRDTGDTSNPTLPPINPVYRYTNNLSSLREQVNFTFGKYNKSKADRPAYNMMLWSDYGLRIKVIDIDSTLNKHSPLNYKRYRVIAEVLDTIKGRVYQPYVFPPLIKGGKSGTSKSLSGDNPYISFQYTPIRYLAYGEDDSEDNGSRLREPDFTAANGQFKMSIGQEAVVFLVFRNPLNDYSYDYYDIDVFEAFPIANDIVKDVNKYWSATGSMNYSDWKAKAFILRDKILTGQY